MLLVQKMVVNGKNSTNIPSFYIPRMARLEHGAIWVSSQENGTKAPVLQIINNLKDEIFKFLKNLMVYMV